MKKFLIATIALTVGACASGPAAKTPAEQITGIWNCKTSSEGITVAGTNTYSPDGKATGDATVNVNQGGMAIDIVATTESNWKFQEDGKLMETVTKMTVKSGKMSGQDVPPAMIQGMVEQMVVNQTVTSTVVFGEGTMTFTDQDNVVTSCKR